MIYQIAEILLPFVLIIDLTLLFLLTLTIKWKKFRSNRVIFVLTLVGFIGIGLFKLLFIEPHSFPSTPTDIRIRNNKLISKIYYIGTFEHQSKAFWTEFVIGEKKERMFDLESSVRDSLTIAKKIYGKWYFKTIKLEFDKINEFSLAKDEFQNDTNGRIQQIINAYRLVETGNYLSNLLTLSFVIGLIIKITGHNTRYSQ